MIPGFSDSAYLRWAVLLGVMFVIPCGVFFVLCRVRMPGVILIPCLWSFDSVRWRIKGWGGRIFCFHFLPEKYG